MTPQLWIVAVLVAALAVVEIHGVITPDRKDTITELFQHIRGEQTAPGWRIALGYAWMFLVVGTMAWCIVHFTIGWA